MTRNDDLAQALRETAPHGRRDHLVRALHEHLCERLLLDADQLDIRDNLSAMGMDSLKAVELKHHLETQLGVALHSSFAFDYPNIEAMASFLLQEAGLSAADAPAQADAADAASEASEASASEVEADLSEDELADLLAQELSTLNPTSGKP